MAKGTVPERFANADRSSGGRSGVGDELAQSTARGRIWLLTVARCMSKASAFARGRSIFLTLFAPHAHRSRLAYLSRMRHSVQEPERVPPSPRQGLLLSVSLLPLWRGLPVCARRCRLAAWHLAFVVASRESLHLDEDHLRWVRGHVPSAACAYYAHFAADDAGSVGTPAVGCRRVRRRVRRRR